MIVGRLIDIVEEHGLVTREGISRYFAKAKKDQVVRLRNDLHEACRSSKASARGFQATTFNYVASASIRGQSHCVQPECRANRVGELARFSLLYAEKVLLPIFKHGGDALSLEGDLMILSELRPLIDLDLVIPAPLEICLCPECAARFEPIREQVNGVVRASADRLSKELKITRSADFEDVHLAIKRGEVSVLRVDWPASYNQAGPTFMISTEPAKVARITELVEPGRELPRELIAELDLAIHYLRNPAWDYLMHGTVNSGADWSYLSDSTLETSLFQSLTNHSPDDARNKRLAAMAHEVPLFSEVSLPILLEVRQQESDIFASYRSAVNEALNSASAGGEGPINAREIYSDVIAPKLIVLEARQRSLSKRFGKNVALSYVPSLATLAVGTFAGAHAAGAGEIVGKLVEAFGLGAFCNQLIQHGAAIDSIKTDPFYFLLKLKRAHEQDCGPASNLN